jgi:hypothetical protein
MTQHAQLITLSSFATFAPWRESFSHKGATSKFRKDSFCKSRPYFINICAP